MPFSRSYSNGSADSILNVINSNERAIFEIRNSIKNDAHTVHELSESNRLQ
jgi:hypothetical protein